MAQVRIPHRVHSGRHTTCSLPYQVFLDELNSCLHVNLFSPPAKRQRAHYSTSRCCAPLPFLFTDPYSRISQHEFISRLSAPRCLCLAECVSVSLCEVYVCLDGSQRVARRLCSSFNTGNKVSLFDSRLARLSTLQPWRLSPDKPVSIFLSLFFFLLFPHAFFPGAQLCKDGSQAPSESRSADPGEQAIRQVP